MLVEVKRRIAQELKASHGDTVGKCPWRLLDELVPKKPFYYWFYVLQTTRSNLSRYEGPFSTGSIKCGSKGLPFSRCKGNIIHAQFCTRHLASISNPMDRNEIPSKY